mmetsp:Transcript_42196/g.90006  ORF Transcript_42196/g.90006 Transcript_42196/m.90006 type:complete len:303 (+) Transcript_42196:857-1765(+)
MMQLDVEAPEVELPEHPHARLVGLLLDELVEELARQRLARLVMECEPGIVDRGGVVAPVLHELRGQLDRVPLDTGNAGGGRVGDRSEHVLQPVAGLVEERGHFREGHQRRLAVDWWRAVAGEVGDWDAVEDGGLADADTHPGAATLVLGPRVGVEVEGGDVLLAARVEDAEELHVWVPSGHALARLDNVDVEKALAEAEEAVQHVREREVGAELLFLKAEELLRLPLRPEGHVPERELLIREALGLGEGGELLELAPRGGQRLGVQHRCELIDRLDRRGHLALHGHLGVGRETEQLSLLLLE